MEPLNNKFQQPEKEIEGKILQQILPIQQQPFNEESPGMPELRKGSKGEMVMKAQRILKTTSDYIGYVDGDFGWIMEAAVQSFQRRSKVPVTGIIDKETWNALNQIRG
ncbi:MAG: peptidoglycan-binding protein [Rivularia sp. ALOHA_DT_140]|nr:peptidoglycan-binding protein [Rivularia sp. ALOHA_DT_140]